MQEQPETAAAPGAKVIAEGEEGSTKPAEESCLCCYTCLAQGGLQPHTAFFPVTSA